MKAKIVVLLILIVVPAIASAQNATIKGVVRDQTRKPIADATVYAVALDNMKLRITTTTNSTGNFSLTNVPAGTYDVRAYKESEGYPDTFFAFFYAGNDRNWQRVRVNSGQTFEGVLLQLGPHYAKLKLEILDEKGNAVGAGIWFMRAKDAKRIYGVGVAPNAELLVPPVPFRFEIEREGYDVWRSKLIDLRSDQTLAVSVHLKPSQ